MTRVTAEIYGSAIDADTCDVSCLHPDAIRPVLGRSLSQEGSFTVASLFSVLADPSRARILHLLAIADDLCVCDVALVLGMTVSALSHQLRYLRERGVVTRNKVGRMAYYRLDDDHIRRLVLDAADHAAEAVA
jgi:DNA-binding transcriptional ArsR family regulator